MSSSSARATRSPPSSPLGDAVAELRTVPDEEYAAAYATGDYDLGDETATALGSTCARPSSSRAITSALSTTSSSGKFSSPF